MSWLSDQIRRRRRRTKPILPKDLELDPATVYHPPVRYESVGSQEDGLRLLATPVDMVFADGRHPWVLLVADADGRRLADLGMTLWRLGEQGVVGGLSVGIVQYMTTELGVVVADNGDLVYAVADAEPTQAAVLRFAGVQRWIEDGLQAPAADTDRAVEYRRRAAQRFARARLLRAQRRREHVARSQPARRRRTKRRREVAKDVPGGDGTSRGTRVNTRRVQTMVTPEVYARLEKAARVARVSVSHLVRQVILQWAEGPEKQVLS